MMKQLLSRLSWALLIGALCIVPASAQTVLSSTTLTANIADDSVRVMAVTSATGFTAPGTGSTQVLALIDREIVSVRTVNSLVIGILRGMNGTRATAHVSGSIVWVGAPRAFVASIPSGQCVRTLLTTVPVIVGGAPGLGAEVGTTWDCLGLTTAGQWVNTNGNGIGLPTLGALIASPAGVLTPSGTYFKVSGTAAITGITVPAGAAPGFTIMIEPTGAFTWTTATNIIVAGTAVVGRTLTFTWNGAKWVASYV